MTDPDPATTAAFNSAFDAWWPHVGPWVSDEVDPMDVAHEAFCAGWVKARAAERQHIRPALEDALEGLREMLPYCSDYFRDKWQLDAYVERAEKAVADLLDGDDGD